VQTLLLASHISLETPDDEGITPLMAACTAGHAAAVQLLLGAHGN